MRDEAEHPLPRGRNAVSRDALIRRNPPIREMRPPRIGSHRRQLKTRVMTDDLLWLGKPNRRRVLHDRLVSAGEVVACFPFVERVYCAVDVGIEKRTLVGAEIVAAGSFCRRRAP